MKSQKRPKATSGKFAIKPEPNKFDDHFLDVIGNTFKFDHPKGLAEWLKNSADGYSTDGARDQEQYILLRFEQANPKSNSVFECIDFVGLVKRDIDEALKVWGSPTAAKKGTTVATYGGHGNGGKFYMRQMYETSQMITYRGGKLNVFGFDKNHRYGFAQGHTDERMSLEDALAFAGIDSLDVPKEVQKRWKGDRRSAGFTVVRGNRPKRFKGRATIETILNGLAYHPQARRLLSHKQVIVCRKGEPWGTRLEAPQVTPKEGFESPREVRMPVVLELDDTTVRLSSKQHRGGKLILRTSATPLTRTSELAALNTIDVIGEVGCIGSYRMNELGFLHYAAESEFIYGELICPILESRQFDAVTNDREKLVVNDATRAVLEWVRQQVDALAEEMSEKAHREKKSHDLQQSSLFNQILDRWKNRFMFKLSAELFGGPASGTTFGGSGVGGTGAGPKAESSSTGDDGGGSEGGGDQGQDGGGAGDQAKKGPRFPRVLLSGHDRDPLDEEATGPFQLDPRQPPIYQRYEDVEQGIYWINTSRPLADKIMSTYTASSARWREYLFQRYVEIILKQTVYVKARQDAQFSPETVDQLIDEVTSRVHDAAVEDLEQFLFDESLTGMAAFPSDE